MSEKVIEEKKTSSIKRILESRLFHQVMPIIFLIILTLIFGAMTKGRFLNAVNLKIIFEQALIVGTVSTGATFIFASGNTNLAMGATTVLTATLAGMVYNATNSFLIMFIAAILIGVFIMVISALISTALNVKVMFVTIVMMTLLASIQQSILGGSTVSVPQTLVAALQSSKFMYTAFIVYFLICVVLFHFTEIGRSLKFIGTNNECAKQTGISKSKYLLIAFAIAGVGCGVGALIVIARAASVNTQTLPKLNMDCMLALVLGGMSIFGGSRSFVYSGIVGALTVCVLNQGLTMIGIPINLIQAIRGIIFLILIATSQTRPKGLPAPEG